MREDLLKSHFVDTAYLKRFKQMNQYNEREFEEVVEEIPCRIVNQAKIIKTAENENIVSTITLYTFTKIGDKDNINGKDVLEIKELKSLFDNKVVGYRVLLWVSENLKVLEI